jgi:cytochrome P450
VTETRIAFPFTSTRTLYHPSAELTSVGGQPPTPVSMPDGSTAWLVTRHAEVRQILVDPVFSRAAMAGPGQPGTELGALTTESLIGLDAPEHSRLRKLVARAFTHRRIGEMRPRVVALVDELLDSVAAKPQPVDLAAMFARPLPLQVICELFGVPASDWPTFLAWSETLMGTRPRAEDETQSAFDGFARLIAQKRKNPGDDLMTALIAARDEQDRLSERELVVLCVGVLVGGHETTANQISLFLLALLEDRSRWERLCADPDGIPQAVEELTRFVQLGDNGVMSPRVAMREVRLGDLVLPAGSVVLPANVAANRDPSVFAEPDTLDLARTENPHLGFGAGIHHCLGAQLARMELQEALAGLVRRMPSMRLAVPVQDLHFKPGLAVRTLEALPVIW